MRKPRRPGGVTAIAIINIVLGSLGLLLGVCGIIGLLMLQDVMQVPGMAQLKEAQDAVAREVPFYAAMQIASVVVLLILSAVLLTGGIGLLAMQNWARVLT